MAMAIAFSCSCGRKINAKDEHAGKRVKCPQCQQVITVPAATGGARPQAVAAGAAARKPAAAAPKKPAPAPVDDDMYDVKEDAPPPKRSSGGASAPASPWGDDDPGLDAPIAAPRPYSASTGACAAAASPRGKGAAAAAAPAGGGMGAFGQLGSKRGSATATKGSGGLHLGPMAKFLIGAAIILPTTFFIFKQGPVKAMKEWGVAEGIGEDATRSVLNRVIHDMDAATMPPPDPDRDNRDGIPYHPEVSHFFYPDPPSVMWTMPSKVRVDGSTTFGAYEGWYFTRDHRVECDMEWKGSEKLKVIGLCNENGAVQKVTVDGIDTTDVAAIKKKFGGGFWDDEPADAKKTIGKAGAAAAKGGRVGKAASGSE
jgi:hypothetical protein